MEGGASTTEGGYIGLRGRVMVSGVLSERYEVLKCFLEGDISCPLKANVLMRKVIADLRNYVDPASGEKRPLSVVLHAPRQVGGWVIVLGRFDPPS